VIVEHYRDGTQHVVVMTGQPEHAPQIGTGRNLQEAVGDLQTVAAVLCTGPDSGVSAALRWAHHADWIGDPEQMEYLGTVEVSQ
jgi:hypothetical protein